MNISLYDDGKEVTEYLNCQFIEIPFLKFYTQMNYSIHSTGQGTAAISYTKGNEII
ncbi:MAG TPA: hypothetical protein PLD02_08325 [Saprospiraceae bacterium]|nr:hypothetical protein [Saprospiraceae bacterium]